MNIVIRKNSTIISTGINKRIIENLTEYKIIKDDFNYDDLIRYKKVIFLNILNNLKKETLDKLFSFLNDNNIEYINITNNLELCLYSDYLYVLDKEDIIVEGNTIDVLKNDKLLKRLGFELPFYIDLSLLLESYGLIGKIYLDKESLKSALWK